MACVVRILDSASRCRKMQCAACTAILALAGCATLRSGESPLAAVDTTVGLRSTDVGRDMDVGRDSTGGSVIGGGGDSVALWMAVLGLATQPLMAVAGALMYQHVMRPRRIRKENGTCAH